MAIVAKISYPNAVSLTAQNINHIDLCNRSKRLRFTDAGPQFLFLLEQDILSKGGHEIDCSKEECASRTDCFYETIVMVKFEELLNRINSVKRFYQTNRYRGTVLRSAILPEKTRIRELIWYFGAGQLDLEAFKALLWNILRRKTRETKAI